MVAVRLPSGAGGVHICVSVTVIVSPTSDSCRPWQICGKYAGTDQSNRFTPINRDLSHAGLSGQGAGRGTFCQNEVFLGQHGEDCERAAGKTLGEIKLCGHVKSISLVREALFSTSVGL